MKKLIVVLLCSATVTSNAFSQVLPIAANMAADTLVSRIHNSLSELITQAEASGTVLGFQFATDANILLQNFGIVSKEVSGKVFGDLSQSQQSIISNMLQLVDKTDRSLNDKIKDANDLVSTVGGEISRLPLVSRRPLLYAYSPSYILNSEASYDVVIKGSLLGSHQVGLVFGSSPCNLVSLVENEARFSCPSEIFNTNRNEWISGTVRFSKPAPIYAFWRQGEAYEYKIGVMTIQEEMAEYSLKAYERRPSQQRVIRNANNGHRNNHCRGDTATVWTYRPAGGCSVDVTTIRANPTVISSNSTFNGVVNASNNGFQVRGVVRNSGRCGPFGVPRDARGSLNVSVNWVDVCSSTEEAPLQEETGVLTWLEDKAFSFPDTLTKYVLTVKQKNGQVKVIDRAEASDWFTVNYDVNTKILIFRPRALLEAFK